ncbi:AbrB family transcriptional regulator [Clostridium omnivorum]|uniref:Membrane protein n=1 Tax=Clostridium omnivorum TaxID=1604902 RepID=A0ABQ5N434_9CLOT|nr:AbrB family transcriptional regulator [Clostridium sp. E14]GLC29889.1 membrane protein [Clostridium sp. E14]
MIQLAITSIIGLIGGLIALRFKVPAGAMVGSMLIVAIFNVITGKAYMPQDVKVITQMAAGAFIGAGIRYKDVMDLRKMIKPAILMVASMITLDTFMGYIMYNITGIDLVTSLFACAPGGIVDMSIISGDLGADSSKVALLQLVRLMSVMTLFPVMMKFISSHISDSKGINDSLEKNDEMENKELCSDMSKSEKKIVQVGNGKKDRAINLTLTLGIAAVFGLAGYKLGVPAGAMTFAMVAVAALNVIFERGYMPLNLRRLTQVFAGVLIGERMTYGDIIALKSVILPAFILLIGIIAVNLLIGFFISRASGLDLITSLLASTPGGVSDMAIIAKDLGGDAPKVAILQLARYVCVIAIFPVLIKLLCT